MVEVLLNQNITTRVLLMSSQFCIVNLPVLPFCMDYPEEMLSFAWHTNLCIHNSESYMFLRVVPLQLYSDLLLAIDSQGYVCDRVHRCLLFLWSIKPFYSGMTRRNKLEYLVHFQDWVKVVVLCRSNANPAFALFYPGVLPFLCQECHRKCTPPLMNSWFSDTPRHHRSFLGLRVIITGIPTSELWCVKINTPSNSVAW